MKQGSEGRGVPLAAWETPRHLLEAWGRTLGGTRAQENRPRPRNRLGALLVSSPRTFNPEQDVRVYPWGRKGLGKAWLEEKPSLEGQSVVQMKGLREFFLQDITHRAGTSLPLNKRSQKLQNKQNCGMATEAIALGSELSVTRSIQAREKPQ